MKWPKICKSSEISPNLVTLNTKNNQSCVYATIAAHAKNVTPT